MDGYGSGWSGPGAKTSPANGDENRQWEAMKKRFREEEAAKREQENMERYQRGEKLRESLFTFSPLFAILSLGVIARLSKAKSQHG